MIECDTESETGGRVGIHLIEREEAAEFFDRLADWAYAQHEACLIDPEPEMQDYEEE